MHRVIRAATFAFGLALTALAAQAAGAVQVTFVQPEEFSDIRDAHRDSSGNLRELKRYLEEQAAERLRDGQTLTIEVLDVDLAGEVRFVRHVNDYVRVLKGSTDWPRIKLRYTLTTADQPARRVEQTLSDKAYLMRLGRHTDGEMLRYEKRMLDEWFDAQFGRAPAR